MTEQDNEEDWAFITFPEQQQQLRLRSQQRGVGQVEALRNNEQNQPLRRTPVKVVTRHVPGVSLPNSNIKKRQSCDVNAMLSQAQHYTQQQQGGPVTRNQQEASSVMSTSSSGQQQQLRRQSLEANAMKFKHSNSSQQNDRRLSANFNQSRFTPTQEFMSFNEPSAAPSSHQRSSSPAVRRLSEQPFQQQPRMGRASDIGPGSVSVRSSDALADEFQFVRSTNLKSPAGESVESGFGSSHASPTDSGQRNHHHQQNGLIVARPVMGLGRRAATQVQISYKNKDKYLREHQREVTATENAAQMLMERQKKNSYNKAVFKSQENLVSRKFSAAVGSSASNASAASNNLMSTSDATNDFISGRFSTSASFDNSGNNNDSSPGKTSTTSSSNSGGFRGHLGRGGDASDLDDRLHGGLEDFENGISSPSSSSTIKKGLLWQQRDKLFSRWKERYFALTKDYLHCFKRDGGGGAISTSPKMTEMGEFLYKVKISEIAEVELLDKRGYLTCCIHLQREGKIYLRKTEGIREWYKEIKKCQRDQNKRALSSMNVSTSSAHSGPGGSAENGHPQSSANGFWARKQLTDSSSIEHWLNKRKGLASNLSDSTPDISRSRSASRSNQKKSNGEITLAELSALYNNADDAEVGFDSALAPGVDAVDGNSPNAVNPGGALGDSALLTSTAKKNPSPVKMRNSRTSINGGSDSANNGDQKPPRRSKIVNRLSLMSDIELPDFSSGGLSNHHPQMAELQDGGVNGNGSGSNKILLRKKSMLDVQSNDSGNNSISTNGSVKSSGSSKSSTAEKQKAEMLNSLHHSSSLDQQVQQHSPNSNNPHQTQLQQQVAPVRRRSVVHESNRDRQLNGGNDRRSVYGPNGVQITHV